MHKFRTLTALVALGLAASGSALAQPADYNAPWRGSFWGYLGASAGESKFRTECASTNVFSCDQRDTAWKVYAGGKFNEVFGLEFGYTDFGRINASGGDTNAYAVPLSLVVGTPLGERFGIFGKVGGLYGHTDVTADPSTLLDTGHKSGWGWTYGVGATFAVSQNLQIRADWDRYKLDFVGGAKDVDMLSAGLQMRF
jgi:opacity protein-like surface antigen